MKLDFKNQVGYLKKDKNVKFNYISEKEAEILLEKTNFYYKLTCYKYNFMKDSNGKYIDLDFANLYDLSILDMRLRHVLSKLCLDIEHTLKTSLIRDITSSTEDGYSIVSEFNQFEKNKYIADQNLKIQAFRAQGRTYNSRQYKDIQKMILWRVNDKNDYDYQMSNSHSSNIMNVPIWILLEKMDYGHLIKFINFYVAERKSNYTHYKLANELLIMTKRIRNASSHNRPILMNIANKSHSGSLVVSQDIKMKLNDLNIAKKNTNEYNRNIDLLEHTKVHDIFCIYVLYKEYMNSPKIIYARKKELKSLMYRITLNKRYYAQHFKLQRISKLLKIAFNNI